MSETLRDKYLKKLTDAYKKENGVEGFVQVYTMGAIDITRAFNAHRYKSVYNKIKIDDIICVKDSGIVPININMMTFGKSKKIAEWVPSQKTGMYQINLSNGHKLFFVVYFYGPKSDIHSLLACTSEEFNMIANIINCYVKNKRNKLIPKTGIYHARIDNQTGDLIYFEIKKKNNEVVHPSISDIEFDVDWFFNSFKDGKSIFTRFGMPGVRKILLTGEPGTGKTSILRKLAKKYSSKMPVVFCNDLEAMSSHINSCAKLSRQTLIFLEDAESSLAETSVNIRASSAILNFLDGENVMQNKNGAFVIMTTNSPEMIENRILKRPGRIDRIFHVGALDADTSLEVAKIFFPVEIMDGISHDELKRILGKSTGAQIKEIAQRSMMESAGKNNGVLDLELISRVKSALISDMKNVNKKKEKTTIDEFSEEVTSVGFNTLFTKY